MISVVGPGRRARRIGEEGPSEGEEIAVCSTPSPSSATG